MTKELADNMALTRFRGDCHGGRAGFPADESGIKPGDVITEINRKQVATPRQFRDAVKSADPKAA